MLLYNNLQDYMIKLYNYNIISNFQFNFLLNLTYI